MNTRAIISAAPCPRRDFERLIRESQPADVFTEDDASRTHSKLAAYVLK